MIGTCESCGVEFDKGSTRAKRCPSCRVAHKEAQRSPYVGGHPLNLGKGRRTNTAAEQPR
jgi:hypothetical protein